MGKISSKLVDIYAQYCQRQGRPLEKGNEDELKVMDIRALIHNIERNNASFFLSDDYIQNFNAKKIEVLGSQVPLSEEESKDEEHFVGKVEKLSQQKLQQLNTKILMTLFHRHIDLSGKRNPRILEKSRVQIMTLAGLSKAASSREESPSTPSEKLLQTSSNVELFVRGFFVPALVLSAESKAGTEPPVETAAAASSPETEAQSAQDLTLRSLQDDLDQLKVVREELIKITRAITKVESKFKIQKSRVQAAAKRMSIQEISLLFVPNGKIKYMLDYKKSLSLRLIFEEKLLNIRKKKQEILKAMSKEYIKDHPECHLPGSASPDEDDLIFQGVGIIIIPSREKPGPCSEFAVFMTEEEYQERKQFLYQRLNVVEESSPKFKKYCRELVAQDLTYEHGLPFLKEVVKKNITKNLPRLFEGKKWRVLPKTCKIEMRIGNEFSAYMENMEGHFSSGSVIDDSLLIHEFFHTLDSRLDEKFSSKKLKRIWTNPCEVRAIMFANWLARAKMGRGHRFAHIVPSKDEARRTKFDLLFKLGPLVEGMNFHKALDFYFKI